MSERSISTRRSVTLNDPFARDLSAGHHPSPRQHSRTCTLAAGGNPLGHAQSHQANTNRTRHGSSPRRARPRTGMSEPNVNLVAPAIGLEPITCRLTEGLSLPGSVRSCCQSPGVSHVFGPQSAHTFEYRADDLAEEGVLGCGPYPLRPPRTDALKLSPVRTHDRVVEPHEHEVAASVSFGFGCWFAPVVRASGGGGLLGRV